MELISNRPSEHFSGKFVKSVKMFDSMIYLAVFCYVEIRIDKIAGIFPILNLHKAMINDKFGIFCKQRNLPLNAFNLVSYFIITQFAKNWNI